MEKLFFGAIPVAQTTSLANKLAANTDSRQLLSNKNVTTFIPVT